MVFLENYRCIMTVSMEGRGTAIGRFSFPRAWEPELLFHPSGKMESEVRW